MSRYSSFSDDFYINLNLNTEMDLPQNRETVLHFFEQVQKLYPTMRNFYSRERGEFVLEEDKERGHYRWTSVESRRVCSGQVNPESVSSALQQHRYVLESVPYSLSISPLDCESLNVMFGFDFTYRGNHNQLVAEALGLIPAFDKLANRDGTTLISNEPAIQFSFDQECRVQCRRSIEPRTSAYHVRAGEFPEEQMSVYITARRYGSLETGESYVSTMEQLAGLCQQVVDEYVIEHILQPLQPPKSKQAIKLNDAKQVGSTRLLSSLQQSSTNIIHHT